MGDFRDFLDMLQGKWVPPEQKGLTISRGASLEPGGFVAEIRGLNSTPRHTSTADLLSAQMRNELVFACIASKAQTSHDPRLFVEKQVRRGGKLIYEPVANHPFRSLFMRPNPDMTEADLMRAALVSWDVSNPRRFYVEKEYTRGLLTALYPLNPAYVSPLMGRSGDNHIGWVWSDGNQRKEYSLDEMMVRRAPAWYNPPPLPAAMGSVESDSAQTDYVKAFFENGGVPPGLLKYDRPLTQPQREEIRERWRDTYGNAQSRQHDIGVLDANVAYQEIGTSLDKLSSPTLRSIAESRICMVFGVPPLIVYAYVGLLRATYSNLKEAWSGFWDATMSPAYKEWRVWWMWNLLSEFEEERDIRAERVRLAYDMSLVAALQEDVDALQERARKNYQVGGITLNEFRSEIGRDAVPNGDVRVNEIPAAPAKQAKARPRTTASMTDAITQYLAGQYTAAANAIGG